MNTKRVRQLNNKEYVSGPIVYWMSRDQRAFDNWALFYAQQLAKEKDTFIAVVFSLRPKFDHSTERMVDFMLKGLEEVAETLRKKNIPFYFLLDDPAIAIPTFITKHKVGALVGDFSPLKYNRKWKDEISQKITIPFYEVDAHNVVPCWIASPKQEFGAYTIRPKINFHLEEFLVSYPKLEKQKESILPLQKTDWKKVRSEIAIDTSVKPVDWLTPGELAAEKVLQEFIEERLPRYDDERNDPTKFVQSQLSPYLHFGHIASQRIALEMENVKGHAKSKAGFLEELLVRKELSDNFCYYNENYDSPKGYPNWSKLTHEQHANDTREFLYTLSELERADTHDPLWNAAQNEMMRRGKMHGYMRMYWAKKIFEWSKSPEEAHKHAIALNDKYFLDGRDPNGYTGIAWSIGGVHDRAWFERAIFGKIRYMNYNGAKSKYKVKEYIERYS
ncbi:MAG: deoxyribodipyrimidine photo-lyase [Candidatus Levybacteria bacterium]|nr:deoxyribodipyrimidine photo-lyase [Candidatus Levybacteria bacterium]